jgi:TRAP transporter TAXI family solute receptor
MIKRWMLGATAAVALVVAGGSAQAQQFFRIGTGGTAGTYYPVGGMIANAVSQPGKLVVTAQASNGSLANVTGIAGGAVESGFSQADVASWAYTGKGVFEGKPTMSGLRMIANLYPESVHIVVRKGAGFKSVADLKGKRVALDEPGSGTLVNARTILAAYGIKESDIKPEYIKPNQAGDKLKDGALDAFFFTGGSPAGAIAELASSGAGIELLPIEGPQADAIRKSDGFFAPDLIAEGTYKGVSATKTLAVGAQWVTSDKADANAVYEITKALFSDAGQKAMGAGHAKGKFITKENAVKGVGIPFHPGAERFYKEAGLLK